MDVETTMTAQFQAIPGAEFLTVRLSGKLGADDYRRFGPEIEEYLENSPQPRLLVEMHDFHGWSLGGLWEDIKFDFRHFADLDRVALVGDRKWERGMAQVCRPFTKAQVRFFDHHEVDQARDWLSAP